MTDSYKRAALFSSSFKLFFSLKLEKVLVLRQEGKVSGTGCRGRLLNKKAIKNVDDSQVLTTNHFFKMYR